MTGSHHLRIEEQIPRRERPRADRDARREGTTQPARGERRRPREHRPGERDHDGYAEHGRPEPAGVVVVAERHAGVDAEHLDGEPADDACESEDGERPRAVRNV